MKRNEKYCSVYIWRSVYNRFIFYIHLQQPKVITVIQYRPVQTGAKFAFISKWQECGLWEDVKRSVRCRDSWILLRKCSFLSSLSTGETPSVSQQLDMECVYLSMCVYAHVCLGEMGVDFLFFSKPYSVVFRIYFRTCAQGSFLAGLTRSCEMLGLGIELLLVACKTNTSTLCVFPPARLFFFNLLLICFLLLWELNPGTHTCKANAQNASSHPQLFTKSSRLCECSFALFRPQIPCGILLEVFLLQLLLDSGEPWTGSEVS